MIKYKELKQLVRFKEKDHNEVRISDFEIKHALNEAIRYLNNYYATSNSDFMEKQAIFLQEEQAYDFVNDGIELPEDFTALVSLQNAVSGTRLMVVETSKLLDWDEYHIIGNKLYAKCDSVRMVYKSAIKEIETEEDSVELPNAFKDILVKLTCLILENAETDIMLKAVEDATSMLIPRRRYSNAKFSIPFKI